MISQRPWGTSPVHVTETPGLDAIEGRNFSTLIFLLYQGSGDYSSGIQYRLFGDHRLKRRTSEQDHSHSAFSGLYNPFCGENTNDDELRFLTQNHRMRRSSSLGDIGNGNTVTPGYL